MNKKITLKYPNEEFILETNADYQKIEGDNLNEKILLLFQTFSNQSDKNEILIKVAALNKIYSTAITNINPVVDTILNNTPENILSFNENDFVRIVDKIATVEWKTYKRTNLSFASKYVHFLSGLQTPIYDSYIWILIKGYLGQNNLSPYSFSKPENYIDFYKTFQEFKTEFNLSNYKNYKIDKFLWQYGKNLIDSIQLETGLELNKAKSELQRRLNLSK